MAASAKKEMARLAAGSFYPSTELIESRRYPSLPVGSFIASSGGDHRLPPYPRVPQREPTNDSAVYEYGLFERGRPAR